jgi:hypothetical protein
VVAALAADLANRDRRGGRKKYLIRNRYDVLGLLNAVFFTALGG